MTVEHDRTPDHNDRRKHRRAGIQLEAILHGATPEDDTRIEVLNFSVGGFLCKIDRPMEMMTKLGIHFEFPPFGDVAPRDITAMSVVVRCDPSPAGDTGFRMASCFIEIDEGSRAHIASYVDWVHQNMESEKLARESA